MTLKQAQNLVQGQWIYHKGERTYRKEPCRVKVLSVKTWVRSPQRVSVSVKYGMYTYFKISESELDVWATTQKGAMNAKERKAFAQAHRSDEPIVHTGTP